MVRGAGSRRWPRGAVAAAVLCAAVVGDLPGGGGVAFAQVTTVWSATLTAGRDAFGGSVWGWRSIEVAMNGDNLTDTTVTFEGVDYPLYSILVVQVTEFNERLILSFSGVSAGSELLDPRVQRAMEFRVGGDSFNLGDAHGMTFTRGILSFNWDFTDYYWTTGDEFAVSLVDTRLKISSARVIDPYFVEVTFNKNLRAAAPGNLVSINVGGRRYPMGTTIVHCRRTGGQNFGCSGTEAAKWLWIQLRWPIYSGDTVTFSYSPDATGGSRLVDRARGDPFPEVRNYPVTNNSSAGKSTVTIESIGATAPEGGRFSYRLRGTANGAIWPPSSKTVSGNAGQHTYSMKYVGPPVTVKYRWRDASAGGLAESRIELQRAARDGNNYWDIEELVQRDAANGPLTVRVAPGHAYNVGTDSSICIRITGSPDGPACSSSQVSADPLTAEFDEVPGSHNGAAFDFQVEFSEAVSATAEQVRSAVSATGATVTAAALADGSDTVWNLTVTPSGTGTVELSLGLTESCTDTGAICTADGRKLSSAVLHQVAFAARLSVARTEATEGDDAALDFPVTLAPAVSGTVTVQYATSDGTATAGEDYTTTTGTLTFAPNETAKTVSVPIIDDTEEDSGETVTLTLSNPTGAVLGDAEATGTILNTETSTTAAALTASFQDVPASHDGDSTFTFGLRFSEDVADLSYVTLRDDAFEVGGGEVANARRKTQGKNQSWEIEVEPDGSGAVTITLPAGAVETTDGRSLTGAVSATVAGPGPLTAGFRDVPASHDGDGTFTFGLRFSEDVKDLSYVTLRDDAFEVDGGEVANARRKTQGENRSWEIEVEPDGNGAVTITLPAGAVETRDGRSLEAAVSASVAGPVGVSVADAEVDEAEGALLAFAVTLSRAAEVAMTVDYATSDGSALAGSDYTSASGTLSFAAGESSKTVEVSVINDDHDEGEETLTLTLSNASAGVLSDGEATGRIKNHDPLPLALVARFGRAAAVHVVEQVEARIEAPRGPGFEGRFAGRRLRRGAARDFALGLLNQLGGIGGGAGAAMHQPAGGGPAGAAASFGTAATGAGGVQATAAPLGAMAGPHGGLSGGGMLGAGFGGGGVLGAGLVVGDVLTGSALSLSRETRQGGIVSFWSRGARSQFAGQDGPLSLGGDVRTTMFGADYAKGPLVAGLSLSHSRGLGEYAGTAGGRVASAVTGLYPWLGYRATDRVTVWGVAGYGAGGMLLTPDGAPALESGLSMAMAAAGTRGELLAGGAGGFELAFKADALWVGTSIGGVDGPAGRLNAAEAAVTRFRTGLEGSRAYTPGGRVSLTPSVEVGLRHDGGDAETGAGMDVGVGLVVSDASTGLAVDVRVRTLVVHQADGFRERGMAVSLSYNPTPSTPLGFAARLAPSWGGEATSGAEALWGRETLAGMAHGGLAQGGRLDGEVGYGLPVGSRLVGTPRAGFGTSEYGRDYRIGYGLAVLDRESLSFDLGVDAQRRESPMLDRADMGFLGRAALGW